VLVAVHHELAWAKATVIATVLGRRRSVLRSRRLCRRRVGLVSDLSAVLVVW